MLGLAAAEDWQGKRISNAGSESDVRRKVVSYYMSSPHLAEWGESGASRGKDGHRKTFCRQVRSRQGGSRWLSQSYWGLAHHFAALCHCSAPAS